MHTKYRSAKEAIAAHRVIKRTYKGRRSKKERVKDRTEAAKTGLKRCPRCNIRKSFLDFYIQTYKMDGLSDSCKECICELSALRHGKLRKRTKADVILDRIQKFGPDWENVTKSCYTCGSELPLTDFGQSICMLD